MDNKSDLIEIGWVVHRKFNGKEFSDLLPNHIQYTPSESYSKRPGWKPKMNAKEMAHLIADLEFLPIDQECQVFPVYKM